MMATLMTSPCTRMVLATSPEQVEQVRRLFREYVVELKVDLCFQDFEAELEFLPGKYGPPEGRLWLALDGVRTCGWYASFLKRGTWKVGLTKNIGRQEVMRLAGDLSVASAAVHQDRAD